jgi:hypothetical protein
MAANSARKQWQLFKKDNPDFEKNREGKADLGPRLDKAFKVLNELKALDKQTRAKAEALTQAWSAVRAAVDDYEGAAVTGKSNDKMKADWNVFAARIQDTTDMITKVRAAQKAYADALSEAMTKAMAT